MVLQSFWIVCILNVIVQFDQSWCSNYFETFYYEPAYINKYSRNALSVEDFKWPNGIVPFVFGNEYTRSNKKAVLEAVRIFSQRTCIRFVPKTSEHVEHIRFIKSTGCGARIGYRPNNPEPLEVSFNNHCLDIPGAIQHELFHVLGILHEQSRYDRDEYVEIIWNNIDPKFKDNFIKIPDAITETFGLPYDFQSLMHYPRNAFVKPNANFTILNKKNPNMPLGQQEGPTETDLEKLRRMYKC